MTFSEQQPVDRWHTQSRSCVQPSIRSLSATSPATAQCRDRQINRALRQPRQVPIDHIQAGDRVWTRTRSMGTVTRPVVRLFRRAAQDLVEVTICGPDGMEAVLSTPMHPFWVIERGWTEAGRLREGDVLSSRCGGNVHVVGVRPHGRAPVYNFEVGLTHNYFVGKAGVLVHNESLNPRHLKVQGADGSWHDEGSYVEY
jgi:hypothetical protein